MGSELSLRKEPTTSALVAAEQDRAIAEAQGAMTLAKKFPRDLAVAERMVLDACKRRGFAEAALYAYPRGGVTVTGPSVRFAEELARAWGNMQIGVRELSQSAGISEVESYAWDLERNLRVSKVFRVAHRRDTRDGTKVLTDGRDIYELVANQGARRLRSCILELIPGDIVEAAVEACQTTLAQGEDEPLAARIAKMAVAFEQFGVPKSAIEKRVGHNLDATTETELVQLRAAYKAIKDGYSEPADLFDLVDQPGADPSVAADPAAPGAALEDAPATGKAPTKREKAASANKPTQAEINKLWSEAVRCFNGDQEAAKNWFRARFAEQDPPLKGWEEVLQFMIVAWRAALEEFAKPTAPQDTQGPQDVPAPAADPSNIDW